VRLTAAPCSSSSSSSSTSTPSRVDAASSVTSVSARRTTVCTRGSTMTNGGAAPEEDHGAVRATVQHTTARSREAAAAHTDALAEGAGATANPCSPAPAPAPGTSGMPMGMPSPMSPPRSVGIAPVPPMPPIPPAPGMGLQDGGPPPCTCAGSCMGMEAAANSVEADVAPMYEESRMLGTMPRCPPPPAPPTSLNCHTASNEEPPPIPRSLGFCSPGKFCDPSKEGGR